MLTYLSNIFLLVLYESCGLTPLNYHYATTVQYHPAKRVTVNAAATSGFLGTVPTLQITGCVLDRYMKLGYIYTGYGSNGTYV